MLMTAVMPAMFVLSAISLNADMSVIAVTGVMVLMPVIWLAVSVSHI